MRKSPKVEDILLAMYEYHETNGGIHVFDFANAEEIKKFFNITVES